MSRFQDLADFARQHRSCGILVPSASSPLMGGYLLTLTCTCGATFDRWVTAEEALELPAPALTPVPDEPASERTADPPGAAAAMAAPPPETPTPPATERETLEEAMLRALDAVEEPEPPRPPKRPKLRLEEALESVLAELGETPEPPPGPRPTPTALRAGPASPAPAATEPSETSASDADRETLEDAMKAALEAIEEPSPGKPRRIPDKQTLEAALRSALEAFDATGDQGRAPGPRAGTRRARLIGLAKPVEPPRRGLTVGLAILIASLLVITTAALWYGIRARSQPVTAVASAPRPPSRPRLPDVERTSVTQAMAALRELQGMSRVDVPYRVYFNRVSFAKADVDRYVQSVRDLDIRSALQGTLAVHVLAATAWRAKTLNERDKWEVIGDDPAVELCPAARRVLSVSDEPPNMSRAQWRGIALAATIPLLWDCTAERMAEIEKSIRDR